jgi:hypothetical protein
VPLTTTPLLTLFHSILVLAKDLSILFFLSMCPIPVSKYMHNAKYNFTTPWYPGTVPNFLDS